MRISSIEISAGFGKSSIKVWSEGEQYILEIDEAKKILKNVLEASASKVLKPGQKIYRLEV